MKSNNWSNTLLVVFSSLQKIVKSIDTMVESHVNSGFLSTHLRYGIQNEKLYNYIIVLNDQKRKMCNLKVIVENALDCLPQMQRELLCLRYIEKKTFQEISELTSVCIRTVFRRYDSAIENFERALKHAGYTEKWIEGEYGDMAIIKTIKERLENSTYLTKTNI